MDLDLQNRVVLITGGASGIGEAIVRGAVQEKAIAIIVDRTVEQATRLQEELRKAGGEVHVVAGDLTVLENCKKAIDYTVQHCGRLDALVNNAGVNDRVGLERGNPSDFIRSLERNLFHYYNLVHYALPALKECRGSIVNISSKTAVVGQGDTSGYVAAKGAILALTREWALELAPYGIRSNAVIPAEVATPLYDSWLKTFPNPDEKLAEIVSRIPLGKRMTSSEEIASMVLFLISGKASHITGQHLFVDGGYVHLDRAIS